MKDVKIYNNDIYVMYADFKGVFNAADHRIIMLKHIRQLGMPPSFVGTCEHLYSVSTTDYNTPYGASPPPLPSNAAPSKEIHSLPSCFLSSSNPSYAGLRSATGATALEPKQPILPPTNIR
jgi:hypothetical protein